MADEKTCEKRPVNKVFCEDFYIFVKKKMKVKTYYLQDKDSSCTTTDRYYAHWAPKDVLGTPFFSVLDEQVSSNYELEFLGPWS